MTSQPPTANGAEQEQRDLAEEQVADEEDAERADTTEGSEQLDDGEPGDRIESFDWEGLLQNYHGKLQDLDHKEQALYNEFDNLTKFFSVWANTVQSHEVDRALKRIYTRQAHVTNSENELELKRQHYIKVVQAFRSALNLLNGP